MRGFGSQFYVCGELHKSPLPVPRNSFHLIQTYWRGLKRGISLYSYAKSGTRMPHLVLIVTCVAVRLKLWDMLWKWPCCVLQVRVFSQAWSMHLYCPGLLLCCIKGWMCMLVAYSALHSYFMLWVTQVFHSRVIVDILSTFLLFLPLA